MKNDPREEAGHVSGMFGRISGWYDFLNHFLSLGMDVLWRKKLARAVTPGAAGTILDLAAGTMDVTCELKRRYPHTRVLAMDFSGPMLRQGQPKLKGIERDVQPVLADGRALPLPQKSVDAVTIAFGIRNIRPREAAYAEILRVLTPGGRLAILEFGSSQKPIWKGLYNFYLNTLLPKVGNLISGDAKAYTYLADTIADFPTAPALEAELAAAGFVNVSHESLLSGIVNIHVAERPAAQGDTFVVAAPAGPEPVTEIQAAPKPAAAPKVRSEAYHAAARAGLTRRAANIEAGLSALDSAVQKVQKAAKAKPAAKKAAPTAKKAAPKTAAKKTAAAKKSEAKPAAKKSTAKTAAAPKKATAKTGSKKTTTKKAAPKKDGPKKVTKKSASKKSAPKK